MAAGWEAYRFAESEKAIKRFERAASLAPENSEQQAKALFGLGTAWWHRRPTARRDLARQYFEKVLQIAPKSDIAAWSLFSIARMDAVPPVAEVQALKQPDRDKAVVAYQRVIDQYPDTAAGHEALMLQQSVQVASLVPDKVQSAVDRLKEFLTSNPNSAYVSFAWSVLANAYELQQKWPEALDAMVKSYETLEVDKTNPVMVKSSVFWNIATVAEFKVGDFETARHFHRLLREKYPRDQLLFSSQLALERMEKKEKELLSEAATAGSVPQ